MLPTALATRLFNTPVALAPHAAEMAVRLLQQVSHSDRSMLGEEYDGGMADAGALQIVEGVAIIPVKGALVQRVGDLWWLASMFGISGYDRIRMLFLEALANPKVDAIVLDVDSPGGEVSGCFDLADMIYRARAVKPIWAILGENAYSAAYALASAAEVITVPRTGGTGSIGVIMMHVSFEQSLKDAGIEVTLITKGDLKGEGSEFFALTKDAFGRLKADVESVGDIFDATVARNRGLSRKKVFDTQAGTYLGESGVAYGLADAVMAPDEAFRALLKELG